MISRISSCITSLRLEGAQSSVMISLTISRRFETLSCHLDHGRFDVPFSYNELVAAFSKCHESAPGADGLPYSVFKVHFLWWRHMLLSFFNLILQWAVVPSVWKSSLVVLLLKRDGDLCSHDSYRPISLASCAFEVFEHLVHARIAPHMRFPLGRRRHGIQPPGLSQASSSCANFCGVC